MVCFEVTEAHAGTSTDVELDFGITGGDLDNFVDGFDFDASSVGAYVLPQLMLQLLLEVLQILLTLKFKQ